MKKALVKIACIVLVLGTLLAVLPNNSFLVSALDRPKSQTISNFKSLCDAHPTVASYESIGKSLLGQDIWIFRFGNPNGGRVMWDAQLHGDEDLGTEIFWIFVQWLLTSSDARAKTFLQNNYLLIIPVINVDSNYRDNMRRQYVLANGTTVNVLYGVNLNRNFPAGWGSYGSKSTSSTDYMGLYGGSEPETQAMIDAFREYKPAVHINTHMWGGPMAWIDGDKNVINTISQSQANYFNTVKPTYNGTAISPYTISVSGLAGGTDPGQSHDMYLGTTSSIVELDPPSDQFTSTKWSSVPLYAVQKYYYPKFLGFMYGTLDAVSQNPRLGSVDFDATLNGKLLTAPTTYQISFPNGTVQYYNRVGGVLYNLPAGTYSISATVSGQTKKTTFSVVAGSQSKILLQFGTVNPLLSDNFEGQYPGKWVQTRDYNDNVALTNVHYYSSTHSVDCSVDWSLSQAQTAYITGQVTPTKAVYVRAKVRFSSLPLTGTYCPLNVRATTASPGALAWVQVEKRTSGVTWAVYWRDSAVHATRSMAISGVGVNANQWYQLELYVKVDTSTTGAVKFWINGNLVFDKSGIDNTEWPNGVQYVQAGERWASPSSGIHSVYIDDVAVSTAYIP